MKNKTSVAGMALAMPFSMNTASSRLKLAWRKGCQTELGWGLSWVFSLEPCETGGDVCVTGLTERCQPHQPNTKATKKTAVVTGRPSSTGSTDAVTTPSNPRPSRHATMRLRCASLPPSMAAHDWCATLSAL